MTYDGPDRRRKRNAVKRALVEFGREPEGGRWHHLWRDFVPLAAIIIALVAVLGVENKVDQARVDVTVAKRVATSQREGRQAAVRIICGALAGVETAGRLVLTDRLPGTERIRPARSRRERQAREVYARAYNKVISDAIIGEAGSQGAQVVDSKGTLDCKALNVAAGTQPPP